jgi:hypothetical protein
MNLSNYYWYFKSAIPPKICDDIIKYGLQHQEDLAITGGLGSNRDLKEQSIKRRRNYRFKKEKKF